MSQKTFLGTVAVIFSLIFILHVLRLLNGWVTQIGSVVIPMWVSWIALVLAGYLAYQSFKLRK